MPDKKTLDLSIVIPFKDHSDLTLACVESILTFADPIKEILLVSNNSSDEELRTIKLAVKDYKNVQVLVYNHPFNFQKINNWAVKKSDGKVLFFLNNDTELVQESQKLINVMYHEALKKSVGAVGAVLLYEDKKTIQHAGVYLIPGGTADHLYIGKNITKTENSIKDGSYPYDTLHNLQVNAVTAAAVMVKRSDFDAISGFNDNFIICGGDVDLCLRLNQSNKKTILVGSNEGYIIHKESRSRSLIHVPYIDFVESYKSYINHFNTTDGDPYIHWKELTHEK